MSVVYGIICLISAAAWFAVGEGDRAATYMAAAFIIAALIETRKQP